MALQPPTAQHLRLLAEAHHFELNEEELAAFQSFLPGIFTALDTLDQAPSNLPPLVYHERDPGGRPSRESDPLNAIIRHAR